MRTEAKVIQLIKYNFEPIKIEEKRKQNISAEFKAESIIQVLSYLKSHSYKHLSTISCVDWIDDNQFELVYHIYSYEDFINISIKTRIDREKATFVTLKEVWPVAEFYERDIHDFFGVEFQGNDNLEELILENWNDIPPMRKDFDTRKFVNDKYEWRDYNGKKHTN